MPVTMPKITSYADTDSTSYAALVYQFVTTYKELTDPLEFELVPDQAYDEDEIAAQTMRECFGIRGCDDAFIYAETRLVDDRPQQRIFYVKDGDVILLDPATAASHNIAKQLPDPNRVIYVMMQIMRLQLELMASVAKLALLP